MVVEGAGVDREDSELSFNLDVFGPAIRRRFTRGFCEFSLEQLEGCRSAVLRYMFLVVPLRSNIS